jgi:hypothetical protein
MDLTTMKNRVASLWPSGQQAGQPAGKSSMDVQAWLSPVEKLVRDRPAVTLAAAFAIGVTIAWFVKRR